MITLEEIKEKLTRLDETILLEILEITSEQIVERFSDIIEERVDYFAEDLEEEEED